MDQAAAAAADPGLAPTPHAGPTTGGPAAPVHPMTARTWTLLLLILLAATGWRFYMIAAESFWYDEVCSLEASTGRGLEHFLTPRQQIIESPDLLSLETARPVWQIWTHMGLDAHPPLYFIVLRLWRDLFGSGEYAVRALSVLIGVLAVGLIFDVGRLAHGRTVGLWAAAIMAISNPQIQFSQEARGYEMLVLLALAIADALLRIETLGPSRGRTLALFAASLAALLTHYGSIPLVAMFGLYALLRLRGDARRSAVVALVAAGAAFALAWGPFFWEQRSDANRDKHVFLFERQWTWPEFLSHLAALPIRMIGSPVRRQIESAWPSVVLFVLPLLMLRKHPRMLLWCLWLAGTAGAVALLAALTRGHHIEHVRYILPAGPAVFLIIAALLADRRGWLRHVLPAAAVLFGLLGLSVTYKQRLFAEVNIYARILEQTARPGDLLAFVSDEDRDWYSGQYMTYSYYAKTLPRPVLLLTAPPSPELLAQIRQYPGVTIMDASKRPLGEFFPNFYRTHAQPIPPHGAIHRIQPNDPSTAPTTRPAAPSN